jgi:hypothetical protein
VKNSLEVKEPFRMINNRAILEQLHDWMGSDAYGEMIEENPQRLYLK